jgi:hypothetical protein
MSRAAVLAFALLTELAAQTSAPPTPDIEVTIHVFDDSTGAGIAGAELSLTGDHSDLKTNISGDCVVSLLQGTHYFLQVKASGYAEGGFQGIREFSTGTKPATIGVPLMQPASLKGTVVDDATDKPLAGIRVSATKLSWLHGEREIRFSSKPVTTDGEGHFLIAGVEPGDLIATTNPPDPQADSDGKPARYPAEVWPGGVNRDDALPVPVPSGATIDLGTLRLHARDLPKLEVTIKGDCARRRFSVDMEDVGINTLTTVAQLADVACDASGTLNGLSPGNYHLAARPSGPPSQMPDESADLDVTIGKDDAKAELIVRRPIRISGRVVTRNGDSESPLANVQVDIAPWVPGKTLTPLPPGQPAKVDSDGRFRIAVYPMPDGHLHASMKKLPPGLFVEAVRYNGSETQGADLNVNPNAISQELTIICSSNFASASGRIQNLKEATASVLFVPWPSGGDTPYPGYIFESETDTDGAFSLTRLPPGRYKILAVPSAERQKLEMPAVLRTLLSTAHDDELHAGSASTVNLDLTSP